MSDITAVLDHKSRIKKMIFDLIVLALIYYVPAIAHLFSYPVYIWDPMRIVVVMSIVYTNRQNAVLLAITLPIFSYLVSGHPIFYKSLVMAGELTVNVLLFFYLKDRFKNLFISLFISIVAAKIFYYVFKTLLVTIGLIKLDVISTPLIMQLTVAVILSVYIQIFAHSRLKGTQ